MGLLLLVWLLGVWPPPLWWRDHWPRETAMMREAVVGRARTGRPMVRPTPLTEISPLLQRMVVIGEDSRFWTHHGIDPAELADALGLDRRRGVWGTVRTLWQRRDRMRGASTITQQLAKNLYLSPSRSLPRKLKEAVTALRLEVALPKKRILELYLNVAEWGPGVWGAQAASRTYFSVPASRLDERAAAALAATLPHPRSSNPQFQPERTLTRRDLILARYHGVDVYVPPEAEEADSTLNAAPVIVPAVDSVIVVSPTADSGRDSLIPGRLDVQRDTADSQPADAP
jgi:monofunctional biosynthetic peptidoglycan transglycosylase